MQNLVKLHSVRIVNRRGEIEEKLERMRQVVTRGDWNITLLSHSEFEVLSLQCA